MMLIDYQVTVLFSQVPRVIFNTLIAEYEHFFLADCVRLSMFTLKNCNCFQIYVS